MSAPVNFYDPWTWFLENLWDKYWKDTEYLEIKDKDGIRKIYLSREGKPLLPIAGGDDFPVPPPAVWTPFGLQFPYIGSGADNASLTGTIAAQFQQYRDVVLSGTLTAVASPQIMICRKLDMAGNTIAGGNLGGAGATGGAGAGAKAVGGGMTTIACTVVIAPAGAVPYDPLEALMALGGASGSGVGGAAVAGSAASAANLFAALSLYYLMIGAIGGGGAGAGAGGTATGTQVSGGRRGGTGTAGGTSAAGGGGASGVGGGSGGGNGNTTGGTGGNGGAGGGILVVVCDDIVGTAGTIHADGQAGTNASGTNAGGGGGGGGGICLVFARHVTTAPTVRANGGAKGNKAGTGGDGAAGGAGISQLVRSS